MTHDKLRMIISNSVRKHNRSPDVLIADLIARLGPLVIDGKE